MIWLYAPGLPKKAKSRRQGHSVRDLVLRADTTKGVDVMQRLSGLLFVLAGISLGAYTYLPPPQDGEAKLAEVTRISAAPDRDLRKQAASDRAAVSLSADSMISQAHAGDVIAKTNAIVKTVPAVPAQTALTTGSLSVAQSSGAWTAVVTADAPANGRLTSSKPGDGETRAQLARDLQRELKRVGCYGGEITGNWSPSTQRAMGAFMDRVNASLPADEPDYILLTLVQGQSTAACGTDCPSGQVMSEGGRCVPHAVVAQATRKSEREQQRRLAAEQKTAAEEQRVASERKAAEVMKEDRRLADAREAQAKADAAANRKAQLETVAAIAEKPAEKRTEKPAAKKLTVAAAEPEDLPWLNGAQQTTAPVVRAAPLPGMMAIGGPRLVAAERSDTGEAANKLDTGMPAPALPAAVVPQAGATEPSAAPILVKPEQEPERAAKPQAKSATQGLPGTKSGVTVRKPVEHAPSAIRPALRPRVVANAHRPAPPPVAYRPAPKPKYSYTASSSIRPRHYYVPRSGPPHYNMMQAYSGIY